MSKFITLTEDSGLKISINIDCIIDIEDKQKTITKTKIMKICGGFLGLQKIDCEYQVAAGFEPDPESGSTVTTIQIKERETEYYGKYSRPYQTGGASAILGVKEKREDILKMIEEVL